MQKDSKRLCSFAEAPHSSLRCSDAWSLLTWPLARGSILVLADQQRRRPFAEGLEQFFAHRSRQIPRRTLLQVGDCAESPWRIHLAAAGLLPTRRMQAQLWV